MHVDFHKNQQHGFFNNKEDKAQNHLAFSVCGTVRRWLHWMEHTAEPVDSLHFSANITKCFPLHIASMQPAQKKPYKILRKLAKTYCKLMINYWKHFETHTAVL